REVSMGVWEQKTWGEIEQDEPEALTRFTRRLDLWQVEGSETAAIVRDRMVAALRDIAAQNPGKTVAAFSHGAALRILLGTLQGFSLEQLGDTPHGDNTAVSRIEAEGDSLRVVYRDDNSHVAKKLSTFAAQTWWKHENAIEPGLYFRPLALPEQQDWLLSRDEEGRPLEEVAIRPTLCAWLEGTPMGILQLYPEKEAESGNGWISIYYMTPETRNHGYGIQLLGQAVRLYRPMGRKRLRIALSPAHRQAQPFFERYGFHPVAGQTDDGCTIWEKNIGMDDE
ncbi:MAG: bifunctional histidine phosphatase family protein/GNAT family N-acetyltransferase, partial [Oscillospiraceae bacterium]